MMPFSKADSLGAQSPGRIADYLNEIGDHEGALQFTPGAPSGQALFGVKRAYTHSSMIVGFIPEADGQSPMCVPIVGVSSVDGDKTLVGQGIKVSLDKLYVSEYPGSGTHTILCEFSAKNQIPNDKEELRYALRTDASDRSGASISGTPIFMGLNVAEDGIAFAGRLVNVRNSLDDALLATFESPIFKTGLTLLSTAQPALKPLASLATSSVKMIMERKKNCQVHSFNLGLDFASGATSARLACGSYVVAQSDDHGTWDWSNFEWNRDAMSLQLKANTATDPGFNYVVLGVSRFSGPARKTARPQARGAVA